MNKTKFKQYLRSLKSVTWSNFTIDDPDGLDRAADWFIKQLEAAENLQVVQFDIKRCRVHVELGDTGTVGVTLADLFLIGEDEQVKIKFANAYLPINFESSKWFSLDEFEEWLLDEVLKNELTSINLVEYLKDYDRTRS